MTAIAQATNDLYSLAIAEKIWPIPNRTIHCCITGQTYGLVSTEYIAAMIDRYGYQDQKRLDQLIMHYRFFGSPCPEWTGRGKEQLSHNRQYDPVGFFIFALCKVLHTDDWYETMEERQTQLEQRANLYDHFNQQREHWPNLVNMADQLLGISGQGCRFRKYDVPTKDIYEYRSLKLREMIINSYRAWFSNWQHTKVRQHVHPQPIFQRVSRKTFGLDDLDEMTADNIFSQIMSAEFKAIMNKGGKNLALSLRGSQRRLQEKLDEETRERTGGFGVIGDGKTVFGFGAQS